MPVISRKWAYCDQMIKNGYNGISYDFDNPEELEQIILNCIENPDSINNMRKNCLLESLNYTEKYVVDKIINAMQI